MVYGTTDQHTYTFSPKDVDVIRAQQYIQEPYLRAASSIPPWSLCCVSCWPPPCPCSCHVTDAQASFEVLGCCECFFCATTSRILDTLWTSHRRKENHCFSPASSLKVLSISSQSSRCSLPALAFPSTILSPSNLVSLTQRLPYFSLAPPSVLMSLWFLWLTSSDRLLQRADKSR